MSSQNGGVDLDSLTDDQRAVLQEYIGVTQQDAAAAVPLLQRTQWNIQIAIARFFDGEPATDPVAEALAAAPPDPRREEVLMNGFSSRRNRNPNLEPAPRIVPQRDTQVSAPLILTLLLTPFSLLYAILSRTFRFTGWLFPFLPRIFARFSGLGPGNTRWSNGRVALKPRDTAARFIREFEEQYSPDTLPFVENGYAQALDAAKQDLKFLLVILISPEHDDTSAYVHDTLLAPSVRDFLRSASDSLLIWGGNVQDAEAYQVSEKLGLSKFPFAALICHTPSVSSTAMSIVARLTGPLPPATFLSQLQQAIERHGPGLDRARRAKQEQQAARSIREQQNSAYERSLAQDRERARRKREEEEAKARVEEEAKRAEEAKLAYERDLQAWRVWRAGQIVPEPAQDDKEAVRISIRLPDGKRVVRRFGPRLGLEELYAFVECHDLVGTGETGGSKPVGFTPQYGFRLVSPMPREVYSVDGAGTVRERIGRNGNLIVEPVGEDEDEEEQ
ncbi:hypothetical protein EJ06DRAFT_540162 [Trichodelitschia bisporula]|uniref:UBX domain-containing protein n=1 Tax=Trichodelitschia bisporula TaxID=703511 RepID=A0A6G1HJ01_9PEZI|nr:hypothetical protein EJ06DRAFT_540162 [Trichodelitschia bisporula]